MTLEELINRQDKLTPEELIKFAYEVFKPDIIATSSFGATSGVLIDLISKTGLPIKIVYVNTGFLFKETLEYINVIKKKYPKLDFIELNPEITQKELFEQYGDDIFIKNPDLCCRINKVEPLNQYLTKNKIGAWITGVRSDQTDFRKSLERISITKGGFYKISPILNWSSKDVYYYMKDNDIPFHPLYEKGYTSIGCEPCTDLPINGERSGRWKNKEKKECGLHTEI